ncbi:uncharacterized protein METZ01_LOCUS100314 [marine metagenome]|uniref:Uncharacterized protein n=1 Tax=marine metagenome TaxID=408172 RepID=A0A381W4K5_9ZZZZ
MLVKQKYDSVLVFTQELMDVQKTHFER